MTFTHVVVVGGGGGGGGTQYVTMGREVPTKGVLFSECLERGCFTVKHREGGGGGRRCPYTCLEKGSCLSGKRVVNYLSLERGIINGFLLTI